MNSTRSPGTVEENPEQYFGRENVVTHGADVMEHLDRQAARRQLRVVPGSGGADAT